MSYVDILLNGGPEDGGRVPVRGDRSPCYGFMLDIPFIEERQALSSGAAAFAGNRAPWKQRRERTAIYKCLGNGEAQFVGVLE